MALPLTQIANGVQNYRYIGPLEAAGNPVSQVWELTNIPLHIRQAIGFEDQLYVWVEALDPTITKGSDTITVTYADVGGQQTPVSMTLTFNSTDVASRIQMHVLTAHTTTR